MTVPIEIVELISVIATSIFLILIGIIGMWYGGRGKRVRALQCIGFAMFVIGIAFIIVQLIT